jgi:hypothetical protein
MGRPRRYDTNAERQRAYRQRKAAAALDMPLAPAQLVVVKALASPKVAAAVERLSARQQAKPRTETCEHRRTPEQYCPRCDG